MQDLLITAGADASIKLWHLTDWLPGSSSYAYALPALPVSLDTSNYSESLTSQKASSQHAQRDNVTAAQFAQELYDNTLTAEHAKHGKSQHGKSQHGSSNLSGSKAMPELEQPQQQSINGPAFKQTTQRSTALQPDTDTGLLQPLVETSATATRAVETKSSKSEWVRCMQLNQRSQLYLATNQGRLYSADLSAGIQLDSTTWHHAFSSPSQAAIVCLCTLDQHLSPNSRKSRQSSTVPQRTQHAQHDKLILGDIRGVATVVQVTPAQRDSPIGSSKAQHDSSTGSKAQQAVHGQLMKSDSASTMCSSGSILASWTAHSGHPVLAVFAPGALPAGHIMTVSISNTAIHWWFVPALLHTDASSQSEASDAGAYRLLAWSH